MGKLAVSKVRGNLAPGSYHDGEGLMLRVQEAGSKSWVQRIYIQGKRRDIGLGSFPRVSLAEARDKAIDNRRVARAGGDPRALKELAPKKSAPVMPTFAEASDIVLKLNAPAWKNRVKASVAWNSTMATYVFPFIGEEPIDAITVADVLAVLTPIWTEKPELASKVRQRLHKVLEWAVAHEHRADNPVRPAVTVLPKINGKGEHFKALPHAKVGETLRTIRGSGAAESTKAAVAFLALTAARSGEVRGATWDEFDTDAALWTVPAARTKTGKEFRVPLSPAALSVLRAAEAHRDGDLVFPSPRGRPLSDNALSKLFRDLGIPAVPHGFRSSFRDWAGETGASREVAEACLAHVVKSKVEAAYARSDLLQRRRALMGQWAAYVMEGSR